MSLLDEESKLVKPTPPRKKKSGRKASSAGLNRFSDVLNPYQSSVQKYRERKKSESTVEQPVAANTVVVEKKTIEPKTEIKVEAGRELVLQKPEIKEVQTESITDSKPVQTESATEYIGFQAESIQSSNGVQSVPHQVSEQVPIGVQKVESELSTPDVGTLTGLQKSTLNFFYIYAKHRGSRIIGPITREEIAKQLKKHKENVKTVIYRLCKKGFLLRIGSKEGRGGFLKLEIPEAVFQQLRLEESTGQQFIDYTALARNQSSEMVSNQSSIVPSSSSLSLDSKNKTTSSKAPLEEEWAEIQIPDILKSNHVGVSVVIQCRDRAVCTAKELQDSLDAFAFDISENNILAKKRISKPQGWFMNAMMNYGGYAKPLNFETEEERLEKEMLARLEARETEKTERKAKIFDLSFKAWKEELSLEEKLKLKPDFCEDVEGAMFESFLRSHFKDNVFELKQPSQ